MNPIVFALRHPITMIMLVVALVCGGALALTRMRVDIFPPINQPSIYVFTNYGGYDPFQMEGLLVSPFELWFQFVDGVQRHGVEVHQARSRWSSCRSIPTRTHVQRRWPRSSAWRPGPRQRSRTGTLPPLDYADARRQRARSATSCSAPRTHSLGEIGDLAMFQVRPISRRLSREPSRPRPYGSSIRAHHRQRRSRQAAASCNFTPQDVVDAVNHGERHQPLGQPLRPGRHMPLVPNNAMVSRAEGLRQHPDQAPAATSTCATSARSPTPRTSTTATLWWTAASRSTCQSSGRARPRRSTVVSDIKRGNAGLQGRVAGGRGRQLRGSTNRRPWSRPWRTWQRRG